MTGTLWFLPIEVAADPPSGDIRHFKDNWWIVHPEKGLALYRRTPRGGVHPQCNTSEQVSIVLSRGALYEGLEVRQVPHVFLRLDSEGNYALPREAVQ